MNQITELKNDQEILFDDFNNLGNYYELSNKEEIFDFLDEHPYLVFDLYNAYPFIRKYFESNELSLEFVPDPEIKELNSICIYISVDENSFDENYKVLDELENEMFNSNVNFIAKILFQLDLR